MTTFEVTARPAVHDHGVALDDTFDFINTLEYDAIDGTPNEHLASPDDVVTWFAERGLIHPEAVEATDRDVERVRALRAAVREVADAVVEGREPRRSALDRVNRAMRSHAAIELVAAPGGVGVGHRHVGDPIDDALARVTEPLVKELSSGHPERLRVCANDMCRWVFYDESRAGRRRWCDMTTCGNRAKAARHRARQRSSRATSE